jgi:hypothetical protein
VRKALREGGRDGLDNTYVYLDLPERSCLDSNVKCSLGCIRVSELRSQGQFSTLESGVMLVCHSRKASNSL